MVAVHKVNTRNRSEVQRFLQIPFRLYKGHPLWVPPLQMDARKQMNPERHPFYEHSVADFFIATLDGQDVGRIAMLQNKPFNSYHDRRLAQFFLFECIEDFGVAQALVERGFEWARKRNLSQVLGPKGFGALDGYGMLVEGYEHRPAMTMMAYNPPYYSKFLEELGFQKEVDFISCYLGRDRFALPERVHRIATRAAKRSGFKILQFKNKREMLSWAPEIGEVYNQTFVNNWEYYPLSEREIRFITDSILSIADPQLIKIVVRKNEVIGFLFGFRDVSAASQRNKGRLLPLGIIDLFFEMRRTKWIAINGAGVLPEYQGRGGNALLYSEMEKTMREHDFHHAELVQVAETAEQMRNDLENVGGVPYKNHRVYVMDI